MTNRKKSGDVITLPPVVSGSTPVIVGVSQVVQRPGERPLDEALGPIELMVEAARAAAADAGAPSLLARAGFVASTGGWFRYTNPAQLVSAQIGCPDAKTAITGVSGTGPQDLVGLSAERIARGEIDVALVLGGEARWSHQRLKKLDREPTWEMGPGEGEPEMVSSFPDIMREEAISMGSAAAGYALFDDSLRAANGTSIEAHRRHIAQLWSRFSKVASTNPYAWDRAAHSADEVMNARPDNRMIVFPYTKAMVANNTVDMATAILICSLDVARAAGVPTDRMVFPHVVTSSHETWLVAERNLLHGAPALTTAGRAAFAATGLGPDDIEHIDLYACFPSIVQMSSAALGINVDRELTVTGGLGFAGAPVGNAVGHSIAAMVERVRGGGLGLVHGNGGQATKHSFAIYSTEPPATFVRRDVQDEVDHRARMPLPGEWTGDVMIEAATVVYGREEPSHVLASVLDSAGARGFATTKDRDAIDAAMTVGLAGTAAKRAEERTLQIS